MINSVAQMGFGAIRIPVTYSDHLDENFRIRPEWLKRVEEVVDYVLDAGLYCIINLHHDTGSGSWPWLRADAGNIETVERRFAIVWEQIAKHFENYGDKLIFEGFNEILDTRSRWTNSDEASYIAVNRLNQVFVNTIRGMGGNNARRFLIVKTYASSQNENEVNSFVIPRDSTENRLIVGVHYYGALEWKLNQEHVSWTRVYSDWQHERDGLPLEEAMQRLSSAFIEQGIPVAILEFGAQNKDNTEDRVNFVTHFIETAKRYGVACFWWDDGGRGEIATVRNFALLDRYRNQWFFPEIAEAIVRAAG